MSYFTPWMCRNILVLEEDSPKLISIMHPNEVLELITQSKMPLEQLLRSYMSLLKKKILDPMIIIMQRTLCSYTNIGLEINGDIEPAPQNIPPSLVHSINRVMTSTMTSIWDGMALATMEHQHHQYLKQDSLDFFWICIMIIYIAEIIIIRAWKNTKAWTFESHLISAVYQPFYQISYGFSTST